MPKSKLLQSTGNIANSALNHSINLNHHLSQSNIKNIPTIKHIQRMSFQSGLLSFSLRRGDRNLDALERRIYEGKSTSLLTWLWFWCVDLILLICEVTFGLIQPIVYFLWMTLVRAILLIAFNLIFFGGIYYLIVF